jgi:Biotin-(acetyl-CoA carboxylase) ligase
MGWPEGWGRIRLETVDSTNEEARRRAAAGEAGPLWIMAERHTAGRGRRVRAWSYPGGPLFDAALLLFPVNAWIGL